MTSTSPLGAEALEKRFQGAHPNPEDIGPAAADHIAHNLAAMAGATNDLLDRHACISGMPDRRVFGLTTKKSLVLAPLGAGKEIGINRSSGERPADRAHALPPRRLWGSFWLHEVTETRKPTRHSCAQRVKRLHSPICG
jgi:hypothetical protein